MRLEIFFRGLEDVYPALDSSRSGGNVKDPEKSNDNDSLVNQKCLAHNGKDDSVCAKASKTDIKMPYIESQTYYDNSDDDDIDIDSALNYPRHTCQFSDIFTMFTVPAYLEALPIQNEGKICVHLLFGQN